MAIQPRTDSDRLDELIEAVEKQTAAIRQAAGSAQEDAEKNRKVLRELRSPLRDLRLLAIIFMVIFVINGCYQTWTVKLQSSAAKNPSASSAVASGFGSSTSR